ncbi:MAG: gliding motility-associated C-terminal domain-containing protein [Saprospiraceae bacterium]|nr:gliding motility-associated C-terminal domain-containing protein [Saprospiraceae bacterium]
MLTLCSGYNIQLNEIGSVVKDTFLFFYYDLKNNITLDTLCTQKLVTGVSNLSSPLEFLSSDPECDLLIDLDRNNSSGLYPYNYQYQDVRCAQWNFEICDEDTYIHTSFSLDSIEFELEGIQDVGYEILDGSGLSGGYQLIQRGNSSYVLLPGLNRSDTSFVHALRTVRYAHNGLKPTSGQRAIRIKGYNAVKNGVDVYSYFTVSSRPNAGLDTSIVLCAAYQWDQFSSLLQGSELGGTWIPSLQSGTNAFDSQNDVFTEYQYIVSDEYCGVDTANIHITRGQKPSIDLGVDQEICGGDSIKLTVPILSMQKILWSDGDTNSIKTIYQIGSYWVELISKDGCKNRDSIEIKKSNQFESIKQIQEICENKSYTYKAKIYYPGQKIIDTISATIGCDTLFEIEIIGIPLHEKQTLLEVCRGDSLQYKGMTYHSGDSSTRLILGLGGSCDTTEVILVKELAKPQIQIAGDSILCFGSSLKLKVLGSGSILWSTGEQNQEIEINTAGQYQVQLTDVKGCRNEAYINIIPGIIMEYKLLSQDPLCIGESSGQIEVKTIGTKPGLNYWSIDGQRQSMMSASGLSSGQYGVKLIDANGCEYEEWIVLKEPQELELGLPIEIEIIKGKTRILKMKSVDPHHIVQYKIIPQSGIRILSDSTIILTGIEDVVYEIIAIDENGCEHYTTLKVIVKETEKVFVANAFSPNGDQINDWIYPQSEEIQHIDLFAVYDRWGNQVLEQKNITSNQATQGWNGMYGSLQAQPGVYIYLIQYTSIGGETIIKKGEFSLIR